MTSKLSLFAIATAALIAGCGGGGDSASVSGQTTPSSPVNQPSSTLFEVTLKTTMPQNSYGADTPEHHAFEKLNRARIECGFGAMEQNVLLDKMGVNQARYNLVELENGNQFSHVQDNRSNPFWIADSLWDRARIAGFITTEVNLDGVGEDIGGATLPIATLSKADQVSQIMMGLLGAPYHAMDLLAPRTQMGVHVATAANSGVENKLLALTNGEFSNAVMVVQPGSPTTRDQRTEIYQWPIDDVLTYPCNATTTTLFTHIIPESVDIFSNTRDYFSQPVGTPFYVTARKGSNLRITSQKLTDLATGNSIPLLPARYGDTEFFPGTTQINTSAKLMDWALIMPDVALENAKRYRMEVTTSINGKSVSKSVQFTPSNSLYTY